MVKQPVVNSRLVETRKCQAQLRDELFFDFHNDSVSVS
jgi:hypothetical protein